MVRAYDKSHRFQDSTFAQKHAGELCHVRSGYRDIFQELEICVNADDSELDT